MSATSAPNPLTQLSDAVTSIVAKAAPFIVSIHSHRSRSSGFVWKPGLIVTADEALADEGEVAVTLPGGTRTPATIVGRDPTTDIALLRLEQKDAPSAPLHKSTPATGALVVAAGSRDGTALAALGAVAVVGPAWRSMRGGDIDSRVE